MYEQEPGRGYAVAVRVQVIHELEIEKVSLSELCRRHQITMHTLLHWRDLYREGGKPALSRPRQPRKRALQPVEPAARADEPPCVPLPQTPVEQEHAKDELIVQLSIQIQQLQQENALLKKVWRLLPTPNEKRGSKS